MENSRPFGPLGPLKPLLQSAGPKTEELNYESPTHNLAHLYSNQTFYKNHSTKSFSQEETIQRIRSELGQKKSNEKKGEKCAKARNEKKAEKFKTTKTNFNNNFQMKLKRALLLPVRLADKSIRRYTFYGLLHTCHGKNEWMRVDGHGRQTLF